MEPQSALEEEIEHLLARAEAADITREEREQLIERLRQSIKQFRQDKGVPATNFWRRLLKISQEAGNNTAGGITPLQAEEPQFHHNDKQLPQLSSDEELFFFSVARQQLETNQRFQIERELQTGQYSTGFIAVDNFTHSRVVLKLPAKGRWSERFEICAEALQAEMTLLPAAQNLVPDSDPEIAELVKHVADGTLTVENWPRPIPWLAQAFARGRRVSDAGLLPEPVVLRILLQVIGLVVKLAAQVPPIAHRDLKADCLFWDEEREKVEVIDWNRATTNPTEQDRKLEFEAIRRLTQELLLGSQFTWSSPDAISDDLFISGRARHLSRGARLLLLRLFAPMPNNAIRDVATLQLVLRHLVLAWSTPFVEGFLSTTELGAKRSDLLDRMDIELRRRQVSQPENIHFSALYKEFIERTQKDIQSRLNTWLTIPTALRAGYRDIVDVWQWLPDMWPLQYLVPLVGLWFSAHPKDQDAELINLVRVMSSSKWDDLSQYSFKPNLEASSLLKIRRQQINEVARAYQNLQKLESAITNSNPDYMDLGRQLQSLADKIPLEAKIIQIQGIISAGLKRQEDIGRLLDKEKTLREQAPTSLLQEELLEVATQLHNLHYTDSDPRRANQQKIVDEIRNAKARLTEAQHSLSSANDWSSVLENVGPLKENPSLSQYAPDLIDELNIIYDKAIDLRRQYLRGMLSSSKDEVKALIDQGQFSDASKRALQAVNTTEQANDPLLSKELDEAWLQCRFATALERAWDQLISGNKRQAHDGLKTLKADNPLVNDLFLICDFTIQAESADSGIGVVEVLKKIVSHKAKTSQGPAIVEEQWDKLKMSVAETAAQKLRDDIASRNIARILPISSLLSQVILLQYTMQLSDFALLKIFLN
jgi:serine/threonine protein kinase